jgi:hypothetical protein
VLARAVVAAMVGLAVFVQLAVCWWRKIDRAAVWPPEPR